MKRWVVSAFVLMVCVASLPPAEAGADRRARRELERIAKMWCQTIRASQVIPVYPLTEDLRPGDVFLVRATQQSETDEWKKKGFLPLDGHQTRLKDLRYSEIYFDGYWKDDYGKVPHELGRRSGADPVPKPPEPGTPKPPGGDGGGSGIALTDIVAPRAAFPSYTFSGEAGMGIRLALPINGLPTALGFLRTTSISGTVTIADAHTYAADMADLYGKLVAWSGEPRIQSLLSGAVAAQTESPVYLRVVSRVYLAGGLIVSLVRSSETRASAAAGAPPPEAATALSTTERADRQNLLDWLNQDAESTKVAAPGGQVRFVGASASSVGMAESFDRPLAVGYLGFDVPVYAGPVLGTPVPTWARIEQMTAVGPAPDISEPGWKMRRTKVDEYALESMLKQDPCRTLWMMQAIAARLTDPSLGDARQAIAVASPDPKQRTCPGAAAGQPTKDAQTAFKRGIGSFVAIGGLNSPRHDEFWRAFDTAFYESNPSNLPPTD